MPFPGVFFAPIPKLFWSAYRDAPFVKCIDCEQPLLESSVFVVNKRFVAGETVFEMAMCNRCREQFTLQYSEETRTNIAAFFSAHFAKNAAALNSSDDETLAGEQLLDHCMNHCGICGIARSSCHRYSIAGLCREHDIIAQLSAMGQTPLMVCEKCELEMSKLVSKQTRESWDRFVDEHFDGPPGVELDAPTAYPVAF